MRVDMQTGKKEAKLMDEQVGIQTISEKRKAKLARMSPYLENVVDDGNSTQEFNETVINQVVSCYQEGVHAHFPLLYC